MADEKRTPPTPPAPPAPPSLIHFSNFQLPPLFVSFTSHTSCDISLIIGLPNPGKELIVL
jgi:hypothetical protein